MSLTYWALINWTFVNVKAQIMHNNSCHFRYPWCWNKCQLWGTYWLAEHNFIGHSVTTDNGRRQLQTHRYTHWFPSGADISFKLLLGTVRGAEMWDQCNIHTVQITAVLHSWILKDSLQINWFTDELLLANHGFVVFTYLMVKCICCIHAKMKFFICSVTAVWLRWMPRRWREQWLNKTK